MHALSWHCAIVFGLPINQSPVKGKCMHYHHTVLLSLVCMLWTIANLAKNIQPFRHLYSTSWCPDILTFDYSALVTLWSCICAIPQCSAVMCGANRLEWMMSPVTSDCDHVLWWTDSSPVRVCWYLNKNMHDCMNAYKNVLTSCIHQPIVIRDCTCFHRLFLFLFLIIHKWITHCSISSQWHTPRSPCKR